MLVFIPTNCLGLQLYSVALFWTRVEEFPPIMYTACSGSIRPILLAILCSPEIKITLWSASGLSSLRVKRMWQEGQLCTRRGALGKMEAVIKFLPGGQGGVSMCAREMCPPVPQQPPWAPACLVPCMSLLTQGLCVEASSFQTRFLLFDFNCAFAASHGAQFYESEEFYGQDGVSANKTVMQGLE